MNYELKKEFYSNLQSTIKIFIKLISLILLIRKNLNKSKNKFLS
jgi:hypothetical protein